VVPISELRYAVGSIVQKPSLPIPENMKCFGVSSTV
jgi:hypothetical protein